MAVSVLVPFSGSGMKIFKCNVLPFHFHFKMLYLCFAVTCKKKRKRNVFQVRKTCALWHFMQKIYLVDGFPRPHAL